MSNKLIEELIKIKGLQIECPECGEKIPIKKAGLFDINDEYTSIIDKKIDVLIQTQEAESDSIDQRRKEILERRKEIRAEPEITKKRITTSTESINFGQIVEKIVPSIKAFPYKPKDCRQLFDPIDYVVFNGLHNSGNINELIFIDVKSGSARLKTNQKDIKKTIEAGKIQYLNVEDIINE